MLALITSGLWLIGPSSHMLALITSGCGADRRLSRRRRFSPAQFGLFSKFVEKQGVGCMELLASELKGRGCARRLSLALPLGAFAKTVPFACALSAFLR